MKSWFATGRVLGVRFTTAILCLILSVSAAHAQEKPDFRSWFNYKSDISAFWKISAVEGDPLKVRIRPATRTPGRQRRVFVLFPRRSSAYDIAMDKILRVFHEKGISAEFTLVNFKLDNTRAKAAIKTAEANGHELIFSMGSQSTAWLHQNYRGRKLPVVSVCSKDPVILGQIGGYNSSSNTNFAYTSLNMPVEVQMAYVRKLRPKLKNIGILVNSQNISAVQTQAAPLARYARALGIRVLNLAIQNPDTAREELSHLVTKAVVAMRKNDPSLDNSLLWITGSTAVFREIETINTHADRVPVLSVVPNVVKAGDDSAVLSIGVSFESNAHLAAIYGAEVLSGRVKVGGLKVGIVTPPDIAINFRKARDIGLRIPFSYFESASYVYDNDGYRVRDMGISTVQKSALSSNPISRVPN